MKLSPTRRRYRVKPETFESLQAYCSDAPKRLHWPHPFVLPAWMAAWWQVFGQDHETHIFSLRRDDNLLGIAPLMRQRQEARFIGNAQVFDYSDFVVYAGREEDFFSSLIDHLRVGGITRLQLHGLRADSTVLTHFLPMARTLDCRTHLEQADVTVELQLPGTWAEYLYALNSKQRHEVRRKLRRLNEAGDVRFRTMGTKDDFGAAMDTFLYLFGSNRQDKAEFMTEKMARYFRTLAKATADIDLLKLCFLDIDRLPVAAVMCFDYRSRRYLYNSGYELKYSDFSVGLLSKVMSIADGIEGGCRIYDFLKGEEGYKFRLGGQALPVYRCLIEL